jgi:hypothetical protein
VERRDNRILRGLARLLEDLVEGIEHNGSASFALPNQLPRAHRGRAKLAEPCLGAESDCRFAVSPTTVYSSSLTVYGPARLEYEH